MYTLDQLLAKYNAAKNRHIRWLDYATEAFRYVTPQRDSLNIILEYLDVGKREGEEIHSTIPVTAAASRAQKLIRMLMPDNERWGTIEVGQNVNLPNLTQTDIETALSQTYQYIHNSSLAQQSQEAMIDECIGSGAIWMESPSDDEPLVYKAIPGFAVMPEFYLGEEVRDVWYIFSGSPSYIIDTYKNLSREVKMAINAKEEKVLFIRRGVVWDPNEDQSKPWRYVDILDGGDEDSYILSDYYDNKKKLAYFRDHTRPGEVVGRGPGINFLPTIRRLNIICRNSDTADEIRSFPPTEIDSSKINPEMFTNLAGSALPIGAIGNSMQIPPSPSVENKILKLEEEIREAFGVKPIGGLNQPVRTAEEISARLDEAQENTTIDVSRLLRECSKPIFEVSFMMLLERGLITKSSQFLAAMKANKKALLFKYNNPLGDIQKNNNLLRLQRALQMSQQYWGPNGMMASFQLDNLQNFFAFNTGLPLDLFTNGQVLKQNLMNAFKMSQQSGQGELPQGAPTAQAVNPLTPEGVSI